MKTLLRYGLYALTALLALGVAVGLIVHEARPTGQEGAAAERLADRMLAAVDAAAWDTTAYVAWDFAGRHQFEWRRDVDSVTVRWGDMRVELHTETVEGSAYERGVRLDGSAAREAVETAWAHFCNDGFWLAAPFKIRDPGTSRALVKTEDGRDALLVSYGSGGVTPGDAYLWHLGDDGRPERYEMWVSIIPVGGLDATWEDYRELSTGALVSTRHRIGPVTLTLDVSQ